VCVGTATERFLRSVLQKQRVS